MLSQDTIARQVRGVLAEVGGTDPEAVAGSARLAEDLGFDSLKLIELAVALEERFPIDQVDETTVLDIATVADVEELVGRLVRSER